MKRKYGWGSAITLSTTFIIGGGGAFVAIITGNRGCGEVLFGLAMIALIILMLASIIREVKVE